jgi:hypothetical protein
MNETGRYELEINEIYQISLSWQKLMNHEKEVY